jgi:putative cell wall-binding protein
VAKSLQNVYIIGSTSVISQSVQNTISQTYGKNVVRYGGTTRADTARILAQQTLLSTSTNTVFLAVSNAFPDAMSASAALAKNGYPILYVEPNSTTLPSETATILNMAQITKVYIIGSTSVIPSGITTAITACNISSSNISRLQGADRFATNLAVQQAFFSTANQGFVATGENFPDALAASPLAGAKSAPVFLVPDTTILPSSSLASFIRSKNFQKLYFMGSSRAVSSSAEMYLATFLPY